MWDVMIRAGRLGWREPARAWLIVRMATWVMVLSGLVNIYSLPRALRLVSPNTRRKKKGRAPGPEELSTAIDSLLGLSFLMFKPSCWKRATVLHRYLALQGISTTIVFGLRKEPDGELKGHAWLEREGRPILEPALPSYKVTYTFPSTEQFEIELALMADTRD
jgi:hypothetical protein